MDTGDKAPDFELQDETGAMRSLSELLSTGSVVLYFYPMALTPGCTAESCHFRDLAAEFAALGAQRVGISADRVEKQKRFSDKHSFDFPLLSDPDKAVARAYGVRRGPGPIPNKRTTFVIGSDGLIKAVVRSETNMNVHADTALATLRSLPGGES
jgi:peroxiredoxin Q/BCP